MVAGGGSDGEQGFFIEPTVIADVKPGATIEQEEIFGPVLALIKANDYDDALEIANDTQFGLTGAVYSTDEAKLERARSEFHVGNLYLNRKCTGALVGVHPFGGFNMSGTDSKAGGRDYLLLFMQAKLSSEKVGATRKRAEAGLRFEIRGCRRRREMFIELDCFKTTATVEKCESIFNRLVLQTLASFYKHFAATRLSSSIRHGFARGKLPRTCALFSWAHLNLPCRLCDGWSMMVTRSSAVWTQPDKPAGRGKKCISRQSKSSRSNKTSHPSAAENQERRSERVVCLALKQTSP